MILDVGRFPQIKGDHSFSSDNVHWIHKPPLSVRELFRPGEKQGKGSMIQNVEGELSRNR